jgi:hypothetical protein
MVWLGFHWDLKCGKLSVPKKKVEEILKCIQDLIQIKPRMKIRVLARFCGKIIALKPALGNVTQIMTRNCFAVINQRSDWDQYINLSTCSACIAELFFWLNYLSLLSPLDLFISDCSTDFYIFSDASETGAAGFIVNSPYICHKAWLDHEKVKSSTWREIKAIQLTLKSLKVLKDCSVTVNTNNQNAVIIVEKGSKVSELQYLALDIFYFANLIALFCIYSGFLENEMCKLII